MNSKTQKQIERILKSPIFKMPQPPGEDFFVFSVFADDPDSPTWYKNQTIMGTWQQCHDALLFTLNMWPLFNSNPPEKIKMMQGKIARDFVQESIKQEIRYTKERKATPNN